MLLKHRCPGIGPFDNGAKRRSNRGWSGGSGSSLRSRLRRHGCHPHFASASSGVMQRRRFIRTTAATRRCYSEVKRLSLNDSGNSRLRTLNRHSHVAVVGERLCRRPVCVCTPWDLEESPIDPDCLRPLESRDGSPKGDEKGTRFKTEAAPATVSGEPVAKAPLGQPGKAAASTEPQARRPAIAGVNAAASGGVS
jgi:hypothetical protein